MVSKKLMLPCNVSNRTLFVADNLPVLRSMNSNSVDLIYLDPPFNTGRQWSNPMKASGKQAISSFEDTWRLSDIHVDEQYALTIQYPEAAELIDAMQIINGDSWKAYLVYMGIRLAEMRRVLQDTGSIFYHCDPVMSHGVKLLMDTIFGKANFCNEIIWYYSNASRGKKKLAKAHDVILWYNKTKKFVFNRDDILAPYQSGMTEWRYKMKGKPPPKGKTPDDVFVLPSLNTMAKERTGYITQKPLTLLDFLVKTASSKGSIVMDPFCGCATTCIAAERLERRWVGIDLSTDAADVIYDRLHKDVDSPLADPKAAVNRIDTKGKAGLPKRTDLAGLQTDKSVLRARLYSNQNKKCAACQKEVEPRMMEIDHIIAQARGGQDVDENLQLLCSPCNRDKGAGSMEALRRKVQNRLVKETMEESRRAWEAKRKKIL